MTPIFRILAWIAALAILAALAAYLALWPVDVAPAAWEAPKSAEYAPTGDFADAVRVPIEGGRGPEDIDVDGKGRVVVGLDDGRIVRFPKDGGAPETIADTGGRPLGLHWDIDGRLIIADALMGLLRLERDGAITTLATECGGRKLGFTDDLETTRDGRIWFTDASVKYGVRDWKLDIIENRPNGRLCVYDPATGDTREVPPGMHFANGVAIDPDGRFILVNETSRYRVRRVWIDAHDRSVEWMRLVSPLLDAPEPDWEKIRSIERDLAERYPDRHPSDILIDNLPGFPDGISTGSNGVFWIAIASPRDFILDKLSRHPEWRRAIVRLPKFLMPGPKRTSRVIGIDAEGHVVADLFDPKGAKITMVTSVQERNGTLYLGSLIDDGFTTMPVPARMPN
ncbi:SMP-30/gluconolactonase/LRE family protein [bacterium]|nr:SMP-30/gluconolactonase/LRE family protein [bacterium]